MARYNYLKRDELGQPQNSIFKTDKRRLNSCSKTETDADTLGTQVVPRKLMGKKQLEVGLHSPSRQAHYRAAVKDAVSLLDMVVLETPEHTVLVTKETKG